MSSNGTRQAAFNKSGRWVKMAPTSKPLLLPPEMPRCFGEVILRLARSSRRRNRRRPLSFGLEGGLVPARAELAAAANVGHRVRAATLEPKFADRRGVAWLGEISNPPYP